jgi:hypothetical protein
LLEDLAEIFLLGGLLGTLSSANFISILTGVWAFVLGVGGILALILPARRDVALVATKASGAFYWIVNFLKRSEGVDVFDRDTDFNPFHGAGS